MKKFFYFAAVAAMFASCAQDELINEINPSSNVEQAIGFGTTSNLITRAENSSATDKSALENYNQTFFVWGNKNVTETPTDPSVFFKQLVKYETSSWTYKPERFWDKSAIKYRFFAVSPAIEGWDIASSDATGGANITTMDGVTKMTFKFTGYEADGLSLAQKATEHTAAPTVPTTNAANYDSQATTQTADVFSENTDLMISTDITNWNIVDGTEKVNLDFNHILSRLNIAVKTGLTTIIGCATVKVKVGDNDATDKEEYEIGDKKYVLIDSKYYELGTAAEGVYIIKTSGDDAATPLELPAEVTGGSNIANVDGVNYQIYELGSGDSKTQYVLKDDNKFYKLTKNDDDSYTIAASASIYQMPTQVFDQTKSSNIVKLTSLEVVQLNNKGDFDESTTLPEGTTLANGTDKRWSNQTYDTNKPIKVSFANSDNATKFTNTPDAATTAEYISGTVIDKFTNILSDKYMFFYQGLVVPQTIKYEAMGIKGPETGATVNEPYLKISYTIDGEPFTYYYNLAGTFQYVYDAYEVNDREVYKTTLPTSGTPVYLYKSGTDYYLTKDGTNNKATIITFTDGKYMNGSTRVWLRDNKFYDNETEGNEVTNAYVLGGVVTRAEATTIDAFQADAIESCSTTFCEGWQNNLYININPAKIEFTAQVYKWVTKIDSEEFEIE